MSGVTWGILTKCMHEEFQRLQRESGFVISLMTRNSSRAYKEFLSDVDELRVFISQQMIVIGMDHEFDRIGAAFIRSCNKVTVLLLMGSKDFPKTPDIGEYLRQVFVGEMLSHEAVQTLLSVVKLSVSPESPGCLHVVFKVLASESESENFKRVVSRAGDGQYAYGYRL